MSLALYYMYVCIFAIKQVLFYKKMAKVTKDTYVVLIDFNFDNEIYLISFCNSIN